MTIKQITEAAANGNTEQLNLLIAQYKNSINFGEALESASQNGHIECVKLLLPVSNPKFNKSQALRLASENGHTECVKLLIPISDPKVIKSYALRWSAINNYTECVELLLPHSDISNWCEKEWQYISCDMQNIIRSYYSKVSLEQNVLLGDDKILKNKNTHKI